MCSEVESGYTFRMGDHEITMRDSFASMLDSTQLTDCLLVCHSHLKDGAGDSAGASAGTGQALTNGHSSSPSAATVRSGLAATAEALKSEEILRTHRVILSASSDYFRSVFSSVTANLTNGVVAVIVTNVDFDDLKAIIDFIYKGQVSVGQSRIHKFLAAAQLLMVKGLMNIKLVSNDNQPLDELSGADRELVQRLQNEKRMLEQEIRSLRELEKSKIDKTKRETELELRKKFDIEKSVLAEEKQRFEAEKMKFTIEREVFEKNKQKELLIKSNNGNPNTNSNSLLLNKQIVVNNSGIEKKVSLSSNQLNGNELNVSQTQKVLRESPTKSGQQLRLMSGPHSMPKLSSTESAVNKSSNNLMTESPTTGETEGRQLRKRKMGDNTGDGTDSINRSNNDMSSMEVEDEDGEVYEVDFSECTETQDMNQTPNRQRVGQQMVNTSAANDFNNTNIMSANPQSAAIVASALAYHKSIPASQVNTRTLRRSTSSHGSASTQSMAGENGTDGETINQRRKGPGRTPNWAKEQDGGVVVMDANGTPNTRGRKPSLPCDGIRQSATSHLYSCPYCPQVYHGNQSMQDHINGIHLNSKTQYICDYCGKVYTWRISLNKHLKTIHPNEPIPD